MVMIAVCLTTCARKEEGLDYDSTAEVEAFYKSEKDFFTFAKPEDAAGHFGVKRGTFYSRVKSKNFTDWCIEIRREEKQCQRAV